MSVNLVDFTDPRGPFWDCDRCPQTYEKAPGFKSCRREYEGFTFQGCDWFKENVKNDELPEAK